MHILDHRHRDGRARTEFSQERGEQPVPRGVLLAQVIQFPARLRGDIEQRAKRPGSQQPVACPPQPAGSGAAALEFLQERGLAHPRFPGHQDQPTIAASGLADVFVERPQE